MNAVARTRSTFRTNPRKGLATVAALALLTIPLAACGEDDGDGGSGGSVEAVASIPSLDKGKDTSVAFNPGFVDALTGLGVTPSAFGKAKLKDGAISFPITGGNVTIFEEGSVPSYVVGQVQHEGSGLTLTAGGTAVTVGNFNVDPGVSVAYGDVAVNGEVAATSIPIFGLDGSTLQDPTIEGNTATLTGTTVYLKPAAADLLNKTFGIKDLNEDIVIGVATITAIVP